MSETDAATRRAKFDLQYLQTRTQLNHVIRWGVVLGVFVLAAIVLAYEWRARYFALLENKDRWSSIYQQCIDDVAFRISTIDMRHEDTQRPLCDEVIFTHSDWLVVRALKDVAWTSAIGRLAKALLPTQSDRAMAMFTINSLGVQAVLVMAAAAVAYFVFGRACKSCKSYRATKQRRREATRIVACAGDASADVRTTG